MAYPTELTLATGTTVYAGDPESDEQVRSREVQVQITYELEDGECDVPLLATAKAAELERVHRVAWEQLCGQADADTDAHAEGEADADTEAEAHDGKRACGVDDAEAVHPDALDADEPQPPSVSSRFAAPSAFPASTPAPTQAGQTGQQDIPTDNRPRGYQNSGSTGYPHAGNAGYPNGSPAPADTAEHQTEAQIGTQIEWATRPQVLALQSHFKRLGVSSADKTTLLRERFGKFRLDWLTKAEAAGLMRTLERGEFADESERGEWEPQGYAPGAAVH